MNNLQKSQGLQDSDKLVNNIKIAVTVAYDRLEVELCIDKLNKISNDIHSEFINIGDSLILQALRNGGLGKYGRTYKLNTQELCIWIREFLKSDEGYSQLSNQQKAQYPRAKAKEERL